jgi:hypothetical protein
LEKLTKNTFEIVGVSDAGYAKGIATQESVSGYVAFYITH